MSKQANKRVRKAIGMSVNRDSLDAYAWPGGYPMFYVCSDGGCLCPKCTNKEIDLIDSAIRDNDNSGWRVVGADVNWEDSSLICDNCNSRIESAYAEDDVEV